MERKFGILMPVFSLKGKYGIGTFGHAAYEFVDFLASCGVKVWQVLPLCPVDFGASPYSSPCGDAINPYYIDLELLIEKGLLTKSECDSYDFGNKNHIDYKKLERGRIELLKKAFLRFDGETEGHEDYALFMALKDKFKGAPWYEWKRYAEYDSKAVSDFKSKNSDKLRFWQFVQNEAFNEWFALKTYANKKGIEIIGDIPFYVSHDSVEVYTNKTLFSLDGVKPDYVAGVPPDYFSKTGQLWGNPVYVWHNMPDYEWWNKRLSNALSLYDRLRLDHFRAFDQYYAIPYGSVDATVGEWRDGPGFEFFKDKTDLPIIAEDLGIITDSVKRLLDSTGYPGMRVLQFGFDGNASNPHFPANIGKNCVCYTGTHDNMTLKEFLSSLSDDELNRIAEVVSDEFGEKISADIDELIDAIIELGCGTDARLFIVPLADLMHKGKAYRINTPSTVSEKNWSIRIKFGYDKVKDYIAYLVKKYNR